MLDPAMYRRAAQIGGPKMAAHYPEVFRQVGFPIHIESFAELGQFIDTMQENRFYGYQEELGGLTQNEFYQVATVCIHLVRFQLLHLPYQPSILPLSTLMAFYCLYKKLSGAKPRFESVLEVGPGCGYLSFFLKEDPHLEDYSQIESCESFYILQNLINIYCFDIEFQELALPEQPATYTWANMPHPIDPQFSPVVKVPSRHVCIHYPVWRLDEVRKKKFDLVTSNANLLEFTPEALDEYLKLIHEVLSGFFVVQCVGNATFGTPDSLVTKLENAGFRILCHGMLTTINMLIVKNDFEITDPQAVAERVYKPNPAGRKTYHPQDFVDYVNDYFS